MDLTKFPKMSAEEAAFLNEHPQIKYIVGLDECGWGAIAGPLVLSACLMRVDSPVPLFGDSKKLSAKVRNEISTLGTHTPRSKITALGAQAVMPGRLFETKAPEVLWDEAARWALFEAMFVSARKIADSMVDNAPLTSLLDYLKTEVTEVAVVVDGTRMPSWPNVSLCPVMKTIPKADGLFRAVSLASIRGKVTRDTLMQDVHKKHPQYGFDKHKGYPTKAHIEALKLHGACSEHRQNIQVVRDNPKQALAR